ncbi:MULTISPECIES: histidinol dehydrogenase [unclassified Rhizobium]|uniref:histidinol dehydrogenase n=1 Tax=unclassified Rhizobium TaxID=2613769 RepID=UPI001ADB8419|nr:MULTISPECIES: histidinol dehydrogenase [unclassified Rhizobium]MBO9099877.1 histidinol dehydrogenase [Rhizobium sp. L58/93]MBO9131580.1 histidinol dehydrogenase [Rhizobium sp. B209b/85]MBO9169866.1 histidinol dehydrogenase [Rhizobium sp. L245/93]MBO9185824.1 histidinol dehydrogenase [Rhizobium sp. E27B/91]QXZ82588.1 histidinol dehydrogenase [Rhizobium sp. K1/93]
MAIWLEQAAEGFEAQFAAFLTTKREVSEDVNAVVRDIIADVRARGDVALMEYSVRFDGIDFDATPMRVTSEEIDAAIAEVPSEVLGALKVAAVRIESHHRRQLPRDDSYEDELGVVLGSRWTAIEAVGIYVPGGTASYPSSVLMNAIPAKVAGVERVVMVVPAKEGVVNPAVLAAARMAGVEEIYRVGGAQAVAALAYGTETIAPVAKITGPGNAYVAAAKRHVFGTVGIDMIAGPSEVLVIADKDNNPDWIAADLLAQAEHDRGAQSILITDNPLLAKSVEQAVERQLKSLGRAETAAASWRDFGAIIIVESLADAIPLANRIAAEHLELAVDDPDALMLGIRNAGAIFIGKHTPEVIGDYVGGSNHVLPTARSARFSSGLSVLDFMKRTSVLKLGAEQLRALGPAAIALANSEGLDAHARSVAIRLNLEG